MRALYLTHPQIRMDANVPVPLWPLSAEGRERAERFAARGVVPKGAMIFSSRETKALELAEILAQSVGTLVLSDHQMGENDRSSTGFLPPALFELAADQFFAHPERSYEGWERAVDAQARIVATVRTAMACVPADTPAVFCGHGGVGTVLKCAIAGLPIHRREDQGHKGGPGGGNGFVFDFAAGAVLQDWTAMEELTADWVDAPMVAGTPVLT